MNQNFEKNHEKYCVPINKGQNKPNETPIYRKEVSVGKDLYEISGKFKTLHELYVNALEDPSRDFLGRREKKHDGTLSKKFTFRTYGKVFEAAERIGSCLVNENMVDLNEDDKERPMKFVGFYSKNVLELYVADIGCCLQNLTIIPFYDTLGEDANEFIFEQTRLKTIFIHSERVDNFLKAVKTKTKYQCVKHVIVLDNIWKEEWETFDNNLCKVHKFNSIIERGSKNVLPWAEVKPDSIYAFSYTSGTTSIPKGAMINHRNIPCFYQSLSNICGFRPDKESHISYLPMAHLLERIAFLTMIMFRGKLGIWSGTKELLFQDIEYMKPTIFISVPRIFNKLYAGIQKKISEASRFKRFLFNLAYDKKYENLKIRKKFHHGFWDALVFNKVKKKLGGKVRIFITGSAPITDEVLSFFRIAFGADFFEVYGQTEGCGLEFSTWSKDVVGGHVGGPGMQNEFKLVDVPGMNYTNKDKDKDGNPRPRGEIWVRGPNVIPGYYKLPEKTKKTFENGWLKSGDIGEIIYPLNKLRLIDRKKNIFKLSQGEYIAPEKLETIYRKANKFISNMYIYGNSLENFIVGVVNIELDCIPKLSKEYKIDKSLSGDEQKQKIGESLLKEFGVIAKNSKLNRLEQLRYVLVDSIDWQTKGYVTTTLKNKRHLIRGYYKERLENFYKQDKLKNKH